MLLVQMVKVQKVEELKVKVKVKVVLTDDENHSYQTLLYLLYRSVGPDVSQ